MSYTEIEIPLPQFTPAPPILRREPFDYDDCIFELKMDGLRALAYVGANETRLLSKNGHTMKRFGNLAVAVERDLRREAVLDGEIVVLDSEGRPRFYDLLRRRGEPVFYVFDVLGLDGKDLRFRPLIERKRILRSILPPQPSVLLYADHVEARYRFLSTGLRTRSGRNRGEAPSRGLRRILVQDSQSCLLAVPRPTGVI